ncbi:hypothetical protein [Clostridium beijerinckii]|uniref:Uncharacterized protein n=1 Tax=Clostridium beijerinckii TaxID=1520 RepID=A0A1S8SEC3_CLOBE|nr:hypothetical protein [Clostridium beijerinckii]NRY60259.1 hypothetical protein [Clostridium beijerinckii]OOM63455.1 hypothetical protein CLBCK_10190 [Clostridium beijerinckii]
MRKNGKVDMKDPLQLLIQGSERPWETAVEPFNGLLKVRDMKIDIALGSHPNQTNMLARVNEITDMFNPFFDENVWGKFIDVRIEMIKKLMETSKFNN